MRRIFLTLFVALVAVPVFAQSTGVGPHKVTLAQLNYIKSHLVPPAPAGAPYRAGQVLVKLRTDIAANFAVSRSSLYLANHETFFNSGTPTVLQFKQAFTPMGWTLWTVPDSTNIPQLVEKLKSTPGVYAAEPNYLSHALLATPNDSDYGVIETDPQYYIGYDLSVDSSMEFYRLWHLDDEQAFAGWSQYPNSWYTASTLPSYRPKIAILDTGLDFNHPDFINAGGTGVDVSQGGQIDVADSGSLVGGTFIPGIQAATDGNGHGTHVTGLALAAGNNGGMVDPNLGTNPISGTHGVIGTGYPCQGVILQVLPANGSANTDSDIGAAIQHAADLGVEVISMSVGGTPYSQLMQDTVNYAFQKGCLVVAAGNELGTGGGALPTNYPAGCTSALAVTANGAGEAIASFSGNGQYIDIAAPGGDATIDQINITALIQFVFSTEVEMDGFITSPGNIPPVYNTYTYLAGTSMATPQVSGAAGLYYAANNLHHSVGYTNVRVFRALERSADGAAGAAGGGWEPTQGFGCLNMNSLISNTDTRGSTVGSMKGIVYYGGTIISGVLVSAKKTDGTGVTYSVSTQQDGTYRFSGLPPGQYTVSTRPFGSPKSEFCIVDAGSDMPGVDFYCGPSSGDTTPPIINYFSIVSSNSNSLTVKHWGLDPETSIASIVWRIGTTSGGSDAMADKNIVPDVSDTVTLTGLNFQPGVTYYLQGTWTNGDGLTTTRVIQFGYSAQVISGTIVFGDYKGSTLPILSVNLRTPGTTNSLYSFTVTPNSSGAFQLPISVPTGIYDVALKGSHWLRVVSKNVNISLNGASGINATLLNGDINNDNIVDEYDLTLLKASYRSRVGGANYNVNADLNGDGIVDEYDLTILKKNYRKRGDN